MAKGFWELYKEAARKLQQPSKAVTSYVKARIPGTRQFKKKWKTVESKPVLRIGKKLQKTTIPQFKLPMALKVGAPGLAVPEVAQEQIRSYGRLFERMATPKGRQSVITSAKKLTKEKPSLKTLYNPAVETALDLPDFFPGGILFSMGAKSLAKGGAKVAMKSAAKSAAKTAVKSAAKTGAKTVPKYLIKSGTKKLLEAPKTMKVTTAEAKKVFKSAKKLGTKPPAFVIKGKVTKPKAAIELFETIKEGKDVPIMKTKAGITKPIVGKSGLISPKLSFSKWRDKGIPSFKRETIARNLEDIAPKQDIKKVKEFFTDKIQLNELGRVEFANDIRMKFRKEVVEKLGIKAGSLEDKLIQRFGEKNIGMKELRQATPKWREVQKATAMFRKQYNELLDLVNKERKTVGADPIPKRADYFTHYQQLGEFIDNFGMVFKNEQLPTAISGKTHLFKPNKPFTPHELARKGGKYAEGAIMGLDKYLDSISRQIFHTDSIQRGRVLEKTLRETAKGKHLTNFANYFDEYVNTLAGKKTKFDTAVENMVGPGALGVMKFLARKTGANMVGGNIASAVTNYIPLIQAAATTPKISFIRGLYEAMAMPLKKNFNKIGGIESAFLTRRFPTKTIDLTPLNAVKNKAGWLFETVDRFTSQTIVSGKYFEKVSGGLDPKSAMKVADEFAARALAERTIGQLPTYFNNKSLRAFTQFQTEVNNYMSFAFKDIPRMAKTKSSAVSMMSQLFIYSYIFNSVYEKITGRRPVLDPIDAALELARKDRTLAENLGKTSMQLLEELPFTSIMTGGRIPLASVVPSRQELSRAITSDKPGKELALLAGETALYTLMPTGGGQVKKFLTGAQAVRKGGSYDKQGRIRFPIDNTAVAKIQAVVFGPWSGEGSRLYFDNEIRALSAKQTQAWEIAVKEKGVDPYRAWAAIYKYRLDNGLSSKISGVIRKENISVEDKKAKLQKILAEYKLLSARLNEFGGIQEATAAPKETKRPAPETPARQTTVKSGRVKVGKPSFTTPKLIVRKSAPSNYKIRSSKKIPVYQIKASSLPDLNL